MNKKSRRKFLVELGAGSAFVAFGQSMTNAFPSEESGWSQSLLQKSKKIKEDLTVDFRYSPKFWQSTYCFPDDAYKSLVGKNGELLYGHQGSKADSSSFAHRIFVTLKKTSKGEYIEQKFEAPGIPIVTTKLQFPDSVIKLVTFASNRKDEGRVDNVIIEVTSIHQTNSEMFPMLHFETKSKFSSTNLDEGNLTRKQLCSIAMEGEKAALFAVVDAPGTSEKSDDGWLFKIKSENVSTNQPQKYFVRFPQEGQSLEKIKDGLREADKLLSETREFWKAWKPTSEKVRWQLNEPYHSFLIQSALNIEQAREIKKGKKVFQTGTTVSRGSRYIETTFMLEAARYLGKDKEAQEGLEAMWDLQNQDGSFANDAGSSRWKDIGAALYSLSRHADLTQNWDYWNELWPDASKSMVYINELRMKAQGTPNGKYGMLASGYGDSGLDGIHAELTNTLWAIIGLKSVSNVAARLFVPRRELLDEILNQLLSAFFSGISKLELRDHPKGFKYLPMVLKDDPIWNNSDERKRPSPQTAQVYLSHAIYPGLFISTDTEVLNGHIELLKSVTKEDIPTETGWLSHDAAAIYNAPIAAQVYLWAKMPELARKTFAGFLNHASPLFSWREEQSLKIAELNEISGDMPNNWASAECIRFLRHCMILEDEDKLRLFEGLSEEDMLSQKPIRIEYSPTKWGRISLSLEPVDKKTWRAKYKREDYNAQMVPKFVAIEFNRRLPAKFELDKVEGASTGQEEIGRVIVYPDKDSWEATFKTFS